MKGIVTEFLNLRTKKASVNAPNPSFLKPGEVVEIVDIVNGDEYEGNNLWFQLIDGSYVWSGGIAGSRDIETKKLSKAKVLFNYNEQFSNIPDHIRQSRGRGIKVALLDTGFDEKHESFLKKPRGLHNASGSRSGAEDKLGHGTCCSGIIAANNGSLSEGIIGIAPEVDLFVSKVANDNDEYFTGNLVKGLRWAIQEVNVDIINMSFALADWEDANQVDLLNLIAFARSKGKILVAAAGNNKILLSGTQVGKVFNFPAMLDGVFAIGAVNESIFQNDRKFNSKLDFIFPLKDVYSTSLENKYRQEKGSSIAAALFSGIASLFLSSKTDSSENNEVYIKRCFTKMSSSLTSPDDLNTPFKIFKP